MNVQYSINMKYEGWAPKKKRLSLPSQRSMMEITRAVSAAFGVPVEDMRHGYSRHQYICKARFAAWHLIREQRRFSLNQIGQAYSFRDHSTIRSGILRAEVLLETDPDFAARYMEARG